MKAKELAKALRIIADVIETHPELFEEKTKPPSPDMDMRVLLSLYAKGESVLMEYLEKFDVKELRNIIKVCGLDKLRRTSRWRKKEKIMGFIVKKVGEYYKKGNVFND